MAKAKTTKIAQPEKPLAAIPADRADLPPGEVDRQAAMYEAAGARRHRRVRAHPRWHRLSRQASARRSG
jgi:hypothetical protein